MYTIGIQYSSITYAVLQYIIGNTCFIFMWSEAEASAAELRGAVQAAT